MTVVFRADDVPPASRTDYWHHVVGETVGPHDVRSEAPFDGRDRLTVSEVGPVMVGELSAGAAAVVRRHERHIGRGGADLCKVQVLTAGRGVVEQSGRRAVLGPGDLVFVDLARPARWTMSPMRLVAVAFPRALLPLHPGHAAALTGVRIPGDDGVGALASSLTRDLLRRVDATEGTDVTGAAGATGVASDPGPVAGGAPGGAAGAAASRLGGAVLDLLAAAMAARIDGRDGPDAATGSVSPLVPPATGRRVALVQVLRFIEDHLADQDLTPAAVAAAHHMSLRSLYTLFEDREATVAGWIRHRRLERCRRDLLDPALRDMPVSAIAARRGLANPAHFSRAFRAAYGVTPVEYRRASARPQA